MTTNSISRTESNEGGSHRGAGDDSLLQLDRSRIMYPCMLGINTLQEVVNIRLPATPRHSSQPLSPLPHYSHPYHTTPIPATLFPSLLRYSHPCHATPTCIPTTLIPATLLQSLRIPDHPRSIALPIGCHVGKSFITKFNFCFTIKDVLSQS